MTPREVAQHMFIRLNSAGTWKRNLRPEERLRVGEGPYPDEFVVELIDNSRTGYVVQRFRVDITEIRANTPAHQQEGSTNARR